MTLFHPEVVLVNMKEKVFNWFKEKSESKYSLWWLLGIAFMENSFSPIPPDPFLAIMLAAKKKSWALYCALTTVASVLGSIFAYFIGFFFFQTIGHPLVVFYNLESQFDMVGQLFNKHLFWTMFAISFTPVPDKVFTMAAGLLRVSLPVFTLAIALGRGLRFFMVGIIMRFFGEKIGNLIFKYFDIATILVIILIVAYFVIKFI